MAIPHYHKWNHIQTRSEFEEVYNENGPKRYQKTEYSILICNECPDTNYLPNMIRIKVTNKENPND